jgi:hypothetical protein
LKIGETAAAWYQTEIARLQDMLEAAPDAAGGLVEGQLEHSDDSAWAKFAQEFLQA